MIWFIIRILIWSIAFIIGVLGYNEKDDILYFISQIPFSVIIPCSIVIVILDVAWTYFVTKEHKIGLNLKKSIIGSDAGLQLCWICSILFLLIAFGRLITWLFLKDNSILLGVSESFTIGCSMIFALFLCNIVVRKKRKI